MSPRLGWSEDAQEETSVDVGPGGHEREKKVLSQEKKTHADARKKKKEKSIKEKEGRRDE
jgi:hypothetical protein